MTRKVITVFIVILLFISAAWGKDFSLSYTEASKFFSFIQDPNAGLTIFPLLEIPAGGENESMGTAYTSVVRDASYLEANPSASSVLKNTELAFLHNDWIADTNIEALVYTERFNNLGIGLGGKFLYVPFTEYDEWGERVAKGYYAENILSANVSYNFLQSFYFHGVAVGGNLKIAHRHIPRQIASMQSAFGIMMDIGVLTRFNFLKFYLSRSDNFSVGMVIENIGPYAKKEPLPSALTIGASYSPIRPLILALDLSLPFTFSPFRHPFEKPRIATGCAVQITPFFSVKSGLLLKEGNPRLSMGTNVILEKIDFTVNYTLDLTTQLSKLDRFSVQAKLDLGDKGRQERQRQVEIFYANAIEKFANGELEKTIEYASKALELKEDFLPAKRLLETASKTLELQQEMEERQKIE